MIMYSMLFVAIGLCFCTTSFFSKEFIVFNNGEPLDSQLSRIVTKINRLPGTEPMTVRFEEGNYGISTPIELELGEHYITFIGHRNKNTVISGSIPVKEWEELPDGLWRGRVPIEMGKDYFPDQLFVNGSRATRSRAPNEDFFVLEDGVKEGSLHGAVLNKDDFGHITLIGEDDYPILTIFRKWTVSKRILTVLSEIKRTLFFESNDFPSYNPLTKGNGLIIENTKNGIDLPGEWCVDKGGYIYYLPKVGEQLAEAEFRIPIVEKLITIKSSSGLQSGCAFKNIVFEHTAYPITRQGVEFGQAASRMSAAIEVDTVEGFSIENCEIRNIANYGVWIRENCHDASISKTLFHNLGAGAVKIGTLAKVDDKVLTRNVAIDNNIVFKYGELMENAVGIILFNAADCSITHNDIHFGNYTGISLGWVWGYSFSPTKRNEVAYNRISHIGTRKLSDLAGIYTLGSSEGTHIHNNIITDVYSCDFRGWGIYADEGTTGIMVNKNIVSRTTSGGFHQHYGKNNRVTNNIFAWGEKSQFTLTRATEANPIVLSNNIFIMESGALFTGGGVNSTSFIVGENCYWTVSDEMPKVSNNDLNTWLQLRDTTSVFLNPSFQDPLRDDFHLRNKSICKRIGFKQFKTSEVGVYGKRKWKRFAHSLL